MKFEDQKCQAFYDGIRSAMESSGLCYMDAKNVMGRAEHEMLREALKEPYEEGSA